MIDFSHGISVGPRSSDPIHIVTYYIKWVTSSWTDGMLTVIRKMGWSAASLVDYIEKYIIQISIPFLK